MTRELRQERNINNADVEKANVNNKEEQSCTSASSSVSIYTMATVAASILFCVGIVIYALIGA